MVLHPIDTELRAWLKRHVENQSALSVAVGHSTSWLHKYVNGDGHATLDDLVRLAGVLLGLNLPVLTENQQKLLKAIAPLGEPDLLDVIAYAEHRGRLARRAPSTGSSAPTAQTPQARASKARGRR